MSNRFITRATTLMATVFFTLTSATTLAEEPKPAANPPATPKASPEQRAAAEAGLKWLAAQQAADGALMGMNHKPSAASTAIAGLAFLSAGSSPDAGAYKDNVRKAIAYLLENRREDGLLAPGQLGAMYAHGFALVFLSESFIQTKDEGLRKQLKPVIEKAIALTESAQNADGGWRYQPQPMDADVSVTSGQVTALQAAKQAGFDVDKRTIARAMKYIEKCQNNDGGFSYMLNAGGSGPARTAAALSVLQRADDADPARLGQARKFLEQARANDKADGHYFYRNYYMLHAQLANALDQAWYDALRADLLKRQAARSGSWDGEAGVEYATAMAVVLLQLPEHPPGTLKAD